MDQNNSKDLESIIKKIQDNPDVLDSVNNAIDKMFMDLGFKLPPLEKRYILKKLLSEENLRSNICAGDGARCCRVN